MGKTSADIDDHLIEQARNLLCATSIEETIEHALLELVRREEIRAHAERSIRNRALSQPGKPMSRLAAACRSMGLS